MKKYQDLTILFQKLDNKMFLSDEQIENNVVLKEFVDQFKHCFRQDPVKQVLWYEPQ